VTLLAEKLIALAPDDVAEAKLYAQAVEFLRKNDLDRAKATTALIQWLSGEEPLTAWLFGERLYVFLRAPVWELVARVARDMNPAPAGAAASHATLERHDTVGSGGESSAQAEGRAPQITRESQPKVGRPAHDRREDMRAMQARLPTIFDTMITRCGVPLGDVRWSMLPRMASENAREATLLKAIYEHTTPDDPNACVREFLRLEALQRMIQQAAEATDGKK
jgi:hypothetical protein